MATIRRAPPPDTNTENNDYIINHKCSISPILMTSNQVQVSQFFSELTQYEDEDVQEIYTISDDYRKV